MQSFSTNINLPQPCCAKKHIDCSPQHFLESRHYVAHIVQRKSHHLHLSTSSCCRSSSPWCPLTTGQGADPWDVNPLILRQVRRTPTGCTRPRFLAPPQTCTPTPPRPPWPQFRRLWISCTTPPALRPLPPRPHLSGTRVPPGLTLPLWVCCRRAALWGWWANQLPRTANSSSSLGSRTLSARGNSTSTLTCETPDHTAVQPDCYGSSLL